MTLTAPEHLRGCLRRDPARRAERLAWLIEQADAGHSGRDMSRALGINLYRAAHILAEAGYQRRPNNTANRLCDHGILVGSAARAIDAMPYDARDALAVTAAKARKPMSAVLAYFWAQHHGAQV